MITNILNEMINYFNDHLFKDYKDINGVVSDFDNLLDYLYQLDMNNELQEWLSINKNSELSILFNYLKDGLLIYGDSLLYLRDTFNQKQPNHTKLLASFYDLNLQALDNKTNVVLKRNVYHVLIDIFKQLQTNSQQDNVIAPKIKYLNDLINKMRN